MKQNVVAPLLNANERDVRVTRVYKQTGDAVRKGERICSIETTKATMEMDSPADGFLVVHCREGQATTAGGLLFSVQAAAVTAAERGQTAAADRLVTKKARELLEKHGLSLDDIPGEVVNEEAVRAKLASSTVNRAGLDKMVVGPNSLLLYCAGPHGRSVCDFVEDGGQYEVAAFMDYGDAPKENEIFGRPVLHRSLLEEVHGRGVTRLHINTNDMRETERVAERARKIGYRLTTIIHPKATVSRYAKLGENVLVGPSAIVGTEAVVGDFSKILNHASIAHHASVGRHCQISDGTRISGHASVGDGVVMGLNSSVVNRAAIGHHVTVVSGVVVTQDVPDYSIVRPDGIHRQKK